MVDADIVIESVARYDKDMKDQLEQFCAQVVELGGLIDKEIELSVKMGWLEKNLPWLPLVRKDRSNEYQKCIQKDRGLRETIPVIYDDVCSRLDSLISNIDSGLGNIEVSQGTKEIDAVIAVRDAFKKFDQKFRYYNWFLRFGRNASKTSFRDRYPDARAIYRRVLSGSDD